MTPAKPIRPRATQPDPDGGVTRILTLATTLLLVFGVFFRPLLAGQDGDDTGTAFFEVAVLFAFVLWLTGKATAGDWTFPAPRLLAGAGAFVAAFWTAALALAPGGNAFEAQLLAEHWTVEIVFFVMLLDHLRTRERRRAVLAAALAAGGVLVAYGIYQRAYALEYFRQVLAEAPELAEAMVGSRGAARTLWDQRVGSQRIYGPYGYANSMAAALILFLPALGFLGRAAVRAPGARWAGRALLAVGAAGLVALLFTGSKGGLLAARGVALGGYLLLAHRARAGRTGWWRDPAAVWMLGAVVTALPAALVWEHPSLAWAGQLASGLLWAGEIVLVDRMLRDDRAADAPPRRNLHRAACATALVLLAGGVWFATGAPGGPERVRKKAEAFRTATRRGTNSVGVRWNYWRAAAGMTADRPLTGMGLDQYGTWYASYKPMEGWAVRRAHSLPLQLLADGGVLLLVGFVAAWGLILAPGRRRDPLPPEPAAPDDASGSAPARQLYWAGLLAAGAAYLLLLSPVFDALGVEFVIREFWGGGATDWPVEKAPALIHLGAHALFMPGVAVAIWWAVWRATARSEGAPAALAAGLRLGLAGFLLHGLVDFTYYVQGLSGYAWALAGVFVCGTVRIDRRVGAVIESKRRRNIVLVGIGAALVAVFALAAVQGAPRGLWPVAHWDRALRVELARRLYYHAERSRDIDRALRLHEAILEDYPDDAESHRYAAMLCKRLLRRQYEAIRSGEGLPPDLAEKARESDLRLRRAAIRHARRAVRLHDGFAPMHAFYGRLLTELAGRDPAAMRAARDAFVRAHERHPHKPEYLRRAGAAEEALGRTGGALRLYRAALALDADPRLTDRTRAGLTEKERRLLEERVARLEAAIETDKATVGDPLPGGNADADGDDPAPEEESRP